MQKALESGFTGGDYSYEDALKRVRRFGDLKLFFGLDISSYDAVRLILVQNAAILEAAKSEYIKTTSGRALAELKDAVAGAGVVIESFIGAFDRRIIEQFSGVFERIFERSCSIYRANMLSNYLESGKLILAGESELLKRRLAYESELLELLKSPDLANAVSEWELILGDLHDFYIGQNTPIKEHALFVIRWWAVMARRDISKNVFSTARCEGLSIILWYFGDLCGAKKAQKRASKIKAILELLDHIEMVMGARFMDSAGLGEFLGSVNKQRLSEQKALLELLPKLAKSLKKLSAKIRATQRAK